MLQDYNNVLVTGGLGFIGSHLVDSLLELDKEVTVFDNFKTAYRYKKKIPPAIKLIKGDIRNYTQILDASSGIDLIFHIAANANGSISVIDPIYDFKNNAMGTMNVLFSAVQSNVKRVVYISSASVYGKPQSYPITENHPKKPFIPYGASKYMGEIACNSFLKTYKLSVVMCRPFCVYGPGENPKLALVEVSRYMRWHLNSQPIKIIGDINKKIRDFVHVSDVINGLIIISDKAPDGEVYNIGSGKGVSMRELTNLIESITGQPIHLDVNKNIKDDSYCLVSDISKLKRLGYKPKISLAKGIELLAKDLGDNPELPRGVTIFNKTQKGEV
jgi:nucleoside-diphosphate-sugar epimerase